MKRVVILDMDNTLYDWLAYWAPAFRGLLTRLSEISGVSTETLSAEFREIFRRHGGVEYSYAVQELPSLLSRHTNLKGSEMVRGEYWPAIQLFQHRRRRLLRLYPGVADGLRRLGELGIKRIALTDGHEWQAGARIKQLGLDRGLLDAWACRVNHRDISAAEVNAIRRYEREAYVTALPMIVVAEETMRKPNPDLLLTVLNRLNVEPKDALMVGDNLMRDVKMAQLAGVDDCWASYGTHYSPIDMATLIRVTDWPPAAVEAALYQSPDRVGVSPMWTAEEFEDVVTLATGGVPLREKERLSGGEALVESWKALSS